LIKKNLGKPDLIIILSFEVGGNNQLIIPYGWCLHHKKSHSILKLVV